MTSGIRVNSGHLVDPFKFEREDVEKINFPKALAQINRFTGQGDYPYSVAQHSSNLVYGVPTPLKQAAAIHDFSEALFNDMASPVKMQMPQYRAAEERAQAVIFDHYNVHLSDLDDLKDFDRRICTNEKLSLFSNAPIGHGLGDQLEPLDVHPFLFSSISWFEAMKWLESDMIRLFS